MIKKMETLIFENEIREKINEIIDVLNCMALNAKHGMPPGGTWMPGPVVDEDIDQIFLEVHTPPVPIDQKEGNLILELEDRMCR